MKKQTIETPITREQLIEKVNELFDYVRDDLDARLNEVLSSGVLDLESYENDYFLAKVVTHALLKRFSVSYRPLSSDGQKLAKNLEYFL